MARLLSFAWLLGAPWRKNKGVRCWFAPHDLRIDDNGDLQNWKDHDAYQQSFARVLRDLTIKPVP